MCALIFPHLNIEDVLMTVHSCISIFIIILVTHLIFIILISYIFILLFVLLAITLLLDDIN